MNAVKQSGINNVNRLKGFIADLHGGGGGGGSSCNNKKNPFKKKYKIF